MPNYVVVVPILIFFLIALGLLFFRKFINRFLIKIWINFMPRIGLGFFSKYAPAYEQMRNDLALLFSLWTNE